MSSGRPGLAELVDDVLSIVLEEHGIEVTSYDAGWVDGCECGWTPEVWTSDQDRHGEWRAHVHPIVAAYLDSRLGTEAL